MIKLLILAFALLLIALFAIAVARYLGGSRRGSKRADRSIGAYKSDDVAWLYANGVRPEQIEMAAEQLRRIT